ncbi:MAG: type IV secretion system DNA-binding domain-containing protein [Candidatus Eisenbacteria bacterium]|uniref:Type IV secretion system DNA-binding domain-containing protein n=1 Tax=Eiseniibacteriota bacterium TaxID=2212470 RepID=A0A948RU35_UNCEI|nr:type IV secretion system DNA-binding domain-containing protein [Candidatus Eisenbacteria bacterium]MBU1949922.1 type IV secretion system DNA-binding domain-containing protein [Candidatus Eisenbacteria bacterium]MBU2690001.1 type IV secretion system DNA-binding domain-containing protein [Candidatus Eisenbacteria bacterium]
MTDRRDASPWLKTELRAESFLPTQMELLTAQFYIWEVRGRGWIVHPTPVALEPPFVPFPFHWVPRAGRRIDDGCKPTFLSKIAQQFDQLVHGRQDDSLTYNDENLILEEPELETDEDDSPIVELRLSAPPMLKTPREAVIQFLSSLPVAVHPLTFEIVGLSDVITAQITVREPDARFIEQQLRAYFPDVVVTREVEYLRSWWHEAGEASSIIVDFALSNEFMLPLKTFKGFDIDPLIAVVSALSNLQLGEVGILQIMFQPTRHPWAENVMRSVTDHEGKAFFMDAPEITRAAKDKVAHPLFAAVIRIGIKSSYLDRAWDIARALGGSLRNLANPAGNELIPLTNDGYDSDEHEEDLLRRRTRRSGMLLNSEELVTLVHPPSASVRAEKLKRQDRKTRAAPAIATGDGLLLGTNIHAGRSTEVTLSADQRSKHLYTVGASGTGKSTLLLNLIIQDLRNGEGIAVLDPHGDLIDRIIEQVPDERIDDVILFDPADADFPVGFNILSAHSELERTLLSSDLVSVFRRLSTSWGDQMTSVLGNAILAILESSRGGTLLDLRRFLVEKRFREEFLATVQDPDVVYYWRKEFPLLKGTPQVSILTRLDTFLRPKLVRYMVAQKDDRLDFRGMMDQGKIFLARLSQGAIGEENAFLLGTLLVSKLQQTAMSRQELAEAGRRPFYLYIDEFQNFITPTMEQILSGARKYRLGLILAHQDLRQLASKSPEVLNSVISNPYTRICFRVGDQDARRLEDGFASFDATDLQNLSTGQAICRTERAEFDFSLNTAGLPPIDATSVEARRKAIVEQSRAKYARRRDEVEEILRAAAPENTRDLGVPTGAKKPSETIPEPIVRSTYSETEAAKARKAPNHVPALSLPPTQGRGGRQHKYLQELVKRWAGSRDWRATIEEKTLDGLGSVDVALRKGDRSVACEIAVTTDAEHEIENIQKCLAAGFELILLISSDKKTLSKVRSIVFSEFAEESRDRVHICTPEDAFAFLENIEAETAGSNKTVRGYKVNVKYKAVGEQEKSAKRQAVSRVIAKAFSRLKK